MNTDYDVVGGPPTGAVFINEYHPAVCPISCHAASASIRGTYPSNAIAFDGFYAGCTKISAEIIYLGRQPIAGKES